MRIFEALRTVRGRKIVRGAAGSAAAVIMLFTSIFTVNAFSEAAPSAVDNSAVTPTEPARYEYRAPREKLVLDASPSSEELVIYILDNEGAPVEDCAFQAIIKNEDNTKLVADMDKDGVISVVYPEPGQYTVSLLNYGDFDIPATIEVTVEEPVAHERMDVSGKITRQKDVDVEHDDSQYGGGNHSGGGTSNDDTVEYVPSDQEPVGSEIVTVPLKDANGNQLYGSVPKLSDADMQGNKYLFNSKGLSRVRATVDENGYLIKAEQEDYNGNFIECTYSVIDQYGYPVSDGSGNHLYTFTKIVELTTTEEHPVYKYTGWQVINGKTYYYDKNGEKVTGRQVIGGFTYYFDADGVRTSTMGIDVSTWNEVSSWSKVKDSGIDYVIVRCGFRGYGSGSLVADDMFDSHMKGALNAGLKVGVYFFTQAVSEKEAVEEASMCLQMVSGYKLSYPIFIDMEDAGSSSARTNKLSNAQRTSIVRAFCDTIRAGGYTAGLYANKYYLEDRINTSQLSSNTVIWLAHYTSKTSYAGHYEMWQYSSTGSVPGIKGYVDLNIGYVSY